MFSHPCNLCEGVDRGRQAWDSQDFRLQLKALLLVCRFSSGWPSALTREDPSGLATMRSSLTASWLSGVANLAPVEVEDILAYTQDPEITKAPKAPESNSNRVRRATATAREVTETLRLSLRAESRVSSASKESSAFSSRRLAEARAARCARRTRPLSIEPPLYGTCGVCRRSAQGRAVYYSSGAASGKRGLVMQSRDSFRHFDMASEGKLFRDAPIRLFRLWFGSSQEAMPSPTLQSLPMNSVGC